jgi:AcrR family transcriptional regulator
MSEGPLPKTTTAPSPRTPLSRERVLRAAIELADDEGIDAVTMRGLGQRLGVEAMSLYHHVGGKEAVLSGVVDTLVGEIDPGDPSADWRMALHQRAASARSVVNRHPWFPRLIVSHPNMSRVMLAYMDGVASAMLAGGLSAQLTHSGMHLLGSRMLGFTQDVLDPRDATPEAAAALFGWVASGAYPGITGSLDGVTHDDDAEYTWSIDLLLDALESARGADQRASTARRTPKATRIAPDTASKTRRTGPRRK